MVKKRNVHDVIVTLLSQIAPEAELDTLDPNADLREALDIDSYDYLNFIVGISDQLGIASTVVIVAVLTQSSTLWQAANTIWSQRNRHKPQQKFANSIGALVGWYRGGKIQPGKQLTETAGLHIA